LGRRKVEGEDGVYKRKYGERFGEGKRGSGGEKGRKGVDSGGDFNMRTRERGALEDGQEGRERVSKDKVVNRLGVKLMKWVEEKG